VGPSGCGKTSLLNAINRLCDLIPGCTVTGRIAVGGRDVRAPDTRLTALRRRVGMVFQQPNPFPLSIADNLRFPLREHGVSNRSERERRTEEALRAVGLWEEVKGRLGQAAHALSGGQQQRLCIARTLVLGPEVLLFDEPCSALDPLSAGVIEALIAGLEGRYTILLVTHNLAQARPGGHRRGLLGERGVRLRGRIRTVRRALRTCRAPHHAGLLRGRGGLIAARTTSTKRSMSATAMAPMADTRNKIVARSPCPA
jgi:ABC-type phosphate transport system ATPase subunit